MSKIQNFQNLKSLPLVMILFVSLNGTFSKNGSFSSSLKGGIMENFSAGKPPDPRFLFTSLVFLFSPQYEIRSNSHRKFFQATAKSNVLSTFCSLSVFLKWHSYSSFFPQIFGRSMHLCCSMYPVIIISYGKGSSKLQIFTLPHTDPARLFCRKSLRCATNKSTKNLGCASAILSILAKKLFKLKMGLRSCIL